MSCQRDVKVTGYPSKGELSPVCRKKPIRMRKSSWKLAKTGIFFIFTSSAALITSFMLLVKYEEMDNVFIRTSFGFGVLGFIFGSLVFSPFILREIVDKEIIQRKYPNGTTRQTLCPQCRSSKINFWAPPFYYIYRCKTCGYQGGIIVEDRSLAQKFQNDFLNSEKLDLTQQQV